MTHNPPQPLVGATAPDFDCETIAAGASEPQRRTLSDYRGRSVMLLFYPRDFSFVCPTELTAFSARVADFADRDCDILGVSVDTVATHREWLETSPDEGGVGPLQFPLASDPGGGIARRFGVWDPGKEVALRGLFVIDEEGVLQYSVVHSLSVGRNPEEVLRVLDAIATGGLCPAGWTRADGTVDLQQAIQAGSVLGHYRIRRSIGRGSFGEVFEACDQRLERPVALKVLNLSITESREALLTEARTAARLNHPNICTIYSVDEEEGLPLIVMELLSGDLLSTWLERSQPGAMRQLLPAIADGLRHAHKHGVAHGDLKPGNIFVTEGFAPKLLDFGLSVARRGSASTPVRGPEDRDATIITAPDAGAELSGIRGTPSYLSPEQAQAQPAGPPSDVYSFGLVMFEVLTGDRVTREESPTVIVIRRREENLAAELVPQVPLEYRPLLKSMLQRDPESRPAMADVVKTLKELAGSDYSVLR